MRAALLLAAAMAAIGGAAATPAQPAATAQDWSTVVAATAEGGVRMGNPDAPVHLVEYGSLTCPHCADFANESGVALAAQVRSGRVSFEYRNFVLNAPDVVLSLLARCQAPAAFFPTIERIYARQEQILAAIDDEETRRLEPLAPEAMMAPLARAMDLQPFFAGLGMPAARYDACLADAAALRALTEATRQAAEGGVRGTPTFLINGVTQDSAGWVGLEPALRAATGG